jgi:hypothetical protein
MSNLSIGESICLSSDDIEPERPVEKTTNCRFDQKGRLFRYQADYRIFNDHYIEVSTRGMFERPRSFELDCTFLDRHARRVLNVDWWSAGLFLLLTACAVLLVWLGPSYGMGGGVLAGGVASTLALAAASLVLCLHRSSDTIVFYTRHGRIPLLKLINGNPGKAELKAFLADVSGRIKRARRGWDNKQQFLSAELREHRRLKDEGILSEESYERVKRRILGKHR